MVLLPLESRLEEDSEFVLEDYLAQPSAIYDSCFTKTISRPGPVRNCSFGPAAGRADLYSGTCDHELEEPGLRPWLCPAYPGSCFPCSRGVGTSCSLSPHTEPPFAVEVAQSWDLSLGDLDTRRVLGLLFVSGFGIYHSHVETEVLVHSQEDLPALI